MSNEIDGITGGYIDLSYLGIIFGVISTVLLLLALARGVLVW